MEDEGTQQIGMHGESGGSQGPIVLNYYYVIIMFYDM